MFHKCYPSGPVECEEYCDTCNGEGQMEIELVASISRNKREGRYLGIINGRHQRVEHSQRGMEPAFREDSCEECGEEVMSWVCSQGHGDNQDYGRYVWWDGVSICPHCDHRQGFSDSSI